MSQYEVSRFLFNFNRDASVRQAYAADRATALVGYDLTGNERRALDGPDFGALYAMQIHPLLLIYMANNLDVPPNIYVAAVNAGAPTSA